METLKYKKVKTRKSHTCLGCHLAYPKGRQMFSITVADSGDIWSYYLCEMCSRITSQMDAHDTYGPGDLFESWPQHQNLTTNEVRNMWLIKHKELTETP